MKAGDIFVFLLAVSVLFALAFPIPPIVLDVFLTLQLVWSFLLLGFSIFSNDDTRLTIFPPMMLLLTVFRLSLNIVSTRLILTRAYAGLMIYHFGRVGTGRNPVIGIALFILLIAIQHIVVMRGVQRIATIKSRFSLDVQEVGDQEESIRQEIDFYAAMDGVCKFVIGDAFLAVVLVVVNVVVGTIVGVIFHKFKIIDSLEVFIILTIGGGIISRAPALIATTSAGILLTRMGNPPKRFG